MLFSRPCRCLAVVASSLAAAAPLPAQASAETKVEGQVLVVGEPGMQYSLSPKGQHMAAVVLRGSRQVMVHDGVDGPRFDEILNVPGGSGRVRWSEDGRRFAYFGRLGQESVVMVDGKEVHRWPAEVAGSQTRVHHLGFTPGGKHWYLILQSNTSGRGNWQLVIDGQAGPTSQGDIAPVWSPDGEHHAYIQTVFPLTAPRATTLLIVDGKVPPYQAGEPQFTADGLHLFTKRPVPGAAAVEVLADGRPFMRAPSVELHMAPAGAGVLGVVSAGIPGRAGAHTFLTVGNRKVPGSECAGSAGLKVYLSPDAKHWAIRCQTGNNSYWIMADGKKGSEYGLILADVAFTADGRAVYAAQMQNKWFVIAGEQESEGYDVIPNPALTS